MQTQEQRREKLERLMKAHPHINREAHLKDLESCKRYLDGDCLPFNEMFEVAYGKLNRYIFYRSSRIFGIHINKQDKEDLIAEVVEAAIKYMYTFQGWSLFSTWMIAIAYYRLINFVTKRRKEKANQTDDAIDENRFIAPPSSYDNNLAVWEILSCLSESDAEIVRLKAVERFAYSEIAKHLNLSIKTVQNRYKKAKEILQDSL